MRPRSVLICGAVAAVALVSPALPASASTPTAGTNVRVTVDQGGAYKSADQLAGGTYTDAVLARCGIDRRMQNDDGQPDLPSGGHAELPGGGQRDYLV